MNRTGAIMVLALLASACDSQPRADEKALADARDVARVEAVQNAAPPLQRFTPEPITSADIEKHKLSAVDCGFRPERGGAIVLLAMREAAYIKVEGELRVYAADSGSPALGPKLGPALINDIRTHYEGREAVIDLQTVGEDATDRSGRVTIRDPYDRVVYSAAGTVECGA